MQRNPQKQSINPHYTWLSVENAAKENNIFHTITAKLKYPLIGFCRELVTATECSDVRCCVVASAIKIMEASYQFRDVNLTIYGLLTSDPHVGSQCRLDAGPTFPMSSKACRRKIFS